jgi:geranylgeranyl diphosphate synthase, type II
MSRTLSSSLEAYFREKRAVIETRLQAALELAEGCPAELAEAMRYSLLAPGKRLRPLLVILALEACDGCEGDAYPAACSVEMIHAYSLIHDDLPAMDDDDLRRGLPTCHVKFGEALAILAGDGLQTLAFQVLTEMYPSQTAAACCRELARGSGAAGMVGGQADDLAWERDHGHGEEQDATTALTTLEHIHAHKTGALFRACLRMGAWAAEASRGGEPESSALERLDAFGRAFGQAFQITDDLLDVEGDAVLAGKRVQKDAARGKLTYPGLLGVTDSHRRAERLCREACDLAASFGERGDRLGSLAEHILNRKH